MAIGAGQLLAQVLLGVSPVDPVTLAATALILVGVVAAASVGLIRRALTAEVNALLRQ